MEENISSQLLSKVMSRLSREQRLRSLRRHLALTTIVLGSLCLIMIPVWHNFWLDWQAAGLVDYLSLLTSDARVVLANWQNYSLGFLESFPVVSTALILGVILATLLVTRLVFKYGQELMKIYEIKQFISK